ncbi:hypothetical protein INT43_000262 [Umbelopsis isabellina]|uniref:Uncharacterized protein n=1 Tax=Mortierella isabellina TaxID=91625 RepID=A0A8H7U928_MORIS|nr:hypothetical protein INT43_000262 [Umbelopsis isabellina]
MESAVAQEYMVEMENASAHIQDLLLVQMILIVSVVVVAQTMSVVVERAVEGQDVVLEGAYSNQLDILAASHYTIIYIYNVN